MNCQGTKRYKRWIQFHADSSELFTRKLHVFFVSGSFIYVGIRFVGYAL